MVVARRNLLLGLGASFLAAPAIVRVASNLMPISVRANDALSFHQMAIRLWVRRYCREALIAHRFISGHMEAPDLPLVGETISIGLRGAI